MTDLAERLRHMTPGEGAFAPNALVVAVVGAVIGVLSGYTTVTTENGLERVGSVMAGAIAPLALLSVATAFPELWPLERSAEFWLWAYVVGLMVGGLANFDER